MPITPASPSRSSQQSLEATPSPDAASPVQIPQSPSPHGDTSFDNSSKPIPSGSSIRTQLFDMAQIHREDLEGSSASSASGGSRKRARRGSFTASGLVETAKIKQAMDRLKREIERALLVRRPNSLAKDLNNSGNLAAATKSLLQVSRNTQALEEVISDILNSSKAAGNCPDDDIRDFDEENEFYEYYDDRLAAIKHVVITCAKTAKPEDAIAALSRIFFHPVLGEDGLTEDLRTILEEAVNILLDRLAQAEPDDIDQNTIEAAIDPHLTKLNEALGGDEESGENINESFLFLRCARFCSPEIREIAGKALADAVESEDETQEDGYAAYLSALYVGGDGADNLIPTRKLECDWDKYSERAFGDQAGTTRLHDTLMQKRDLLPTRRAVASYLSRAGNDREAAARFLDLLAQSPQARPDTHLQSIARASMQTWGRTSPLTHSQSVMLAKMLLEDPAAHANALAHLFPLIEFNCGKPVTAWGATCAKLLFDFEPRALRNETPLAQELSARLTTATTEVRPVPDPEFFNRLAQEGWKPERCLGRTIVFGGGQEGQRIAVKLLKPGESICELAKQCEMVRFLQEKRDELKLLGACPRPLGLVHIPGAANAVRHFFTAAETGIQDRVEFGADESVVAYAYQCSPDYLTYLHQANSPEEFGVAAWKGLHDVITLMDRCAILFPQLADLFHNRADDRSDRDGGRYQALSAFFYDSNGSCGKLEDWLGAVEYVNLRMSGLADEGDCAPIRSTMDPNGDFIRKYHFRLIDNLRDAHFFEADSANTRTLLLANFLGEYLLTLELSAGRFARERSKGMDPEQANAVWKETAEQMKTICSKMIAHYSGTPLEKIDKFLDHAVDWNRYARQMQFWMSSENEYIQTILDISTGKQQVPDDLYGQGKWVERARMLAPGETPVDTGRFEFFPSNFKTVGFSMKGDINCPDLGGLNGVDPRTEAEKARFIAATMALLLQPDSPVSQAQ